MNSLLKIWLLSIESVNKAFIHKTFPDKAFIDKEDYHDSSEEQVW